jgi:hypothetical protein
MTRKISLILIASVVSIVLMAAIELPEAAARTINFSAQLQGSVQTVPFTLGGPNPAAQISAQGTSNLGPVSSQAIQEADPSSSVTAATCSAGQQGFSTGGGSFITTFWNGDQLYTQLTSLSECCTVNSPPSSPVTLPSLQPPTYGSCSYTEQATVIGGTGCFNGATGTLNGSGSVQFLNGLLPFGVFGAGNESVSGTLTLVTKGCLL